VEESGMGLFRRLSKWDRAMHQYFVVRYPKVTKSVDRRLEKLFKMGTSPALALIVALLLAVLVLSDKISLIAGICLGLAWLVALVWMARSESIKRLSIVSRILATTLCGLVLGVAASAFGTWAISREHPVNLVFIFGGPLGDNDSTRWVMMERHFGPNPAFNCDLEFTDLGSSSFDWDPLDPDNQSYLETSETRKFLAVCSMDG
jgi:hypothetical protein